MSNSFISTCQVIFYQVVYNSSKWGLLFLVVRIIVRMINQSRRKRPDVVGLRWISSWLHRFALHVEGTFGYITVILFGSYCLASAGLLLARLTWVPVSDELARIGHDEKASWYRAFHTYSVTPTFCFFVSNEWCNTTHLSLQYCRILKTPLTYLLVQNVT